MQTSSQDKKELLISKLKNHDWYFHYSDSMKVYSNGERSQKEIMELVKEMGEEGKRIFNENSPQDMKIA